MKVTKCLKCSRYYKWWHYCNGTLKIIINFNKKKYGKM